MYKPASLRAAIIATVPDLDDQERLVIFVSDGSVVCRPTGLSYEYRYRLEVNVLDYQHAPDLLMVTVLDWLKTNQPDILQQHPEQAARRFTFETDIITNTVVDIAIRLELTENVRVQRDGDVQTITHLAEPVADFGNVPEEWRFYVQGELVGSYRKTTPDAEPTAIPDAEL